MEIVNAKREHAAFLAVLEAACFSDPLTPDMLTR